MAPLLNLGYDRAGKWGYKRGRRDKKGTKRKKEKGVEEEGRRGDFTFEQYYKSPFFIINVLAD
jgi:hypothetical protein